MKTASVKRNYLYSLSYHILAFLTPIITAPYVSRVLEPDGVGISSYTSSIMAYFTMFAQLGTANYGKREIARLRDNKNDMSKAFWEIEIISIVCTSVCFIAWMGLITCSEFYKYYFLALTPTLIATAFDISWFYAGIEQMGYTVARNILCRIIGIVALFVFVREKNDLCLYLVLNSIILLLGNISMWSYMKRFVSWVPMRSMRFVRHFKQTLSYFLISITISLYTVLDKVLIGLLTGDSFQNGYYEQANKIIRMTSVFCFTSINHVMGPRMSYLFAKHDYVEIRRRISNSMNIILFLSLGCTFGIICTSASFVPIFFGKGYEPVVLLVTAMSPLIFVTGISTCLGNHLYIPSGQVNTSTKMITFTALLNLTLNIILIPKFNALGAVVSSVLAEGVNSVMYCYNGRAFITFKSIAQMSYKRFFAGAIMAMSCLYIFKFNQGVAALFSQILFATLVYFGLLFFMRDAVVLSVLSYFRKSFRK